MSDLYEVYQHPGRAAWGVSIGSERISAVFLNGSQMKSYTLPAHQLAAEIGKQVRLGFTKIKRPKYLLVKDLPNGTQSGEFVDLHPELMTDQVIVVFTPVGKADDLPALAKQWEVQLEKTSASAREIEDWLNSIQKAKGYIVAQGTHPAFALVLADWAMSQKRMLVAGNEFIPIVLPSQGPLEWSKWLADFFVDSKPIREALDDLGWSMRELLNQVPQSAEQTPTSGEGWFASATDVSF